MSTNAAFKLQDAGFTRQQVEALSEFTDTQAASKTDLQASEHRLETIITAVRSDLDASERRLETKLAEAKADILKWMFGAMGFQTLVIIGAVVVLLKLAGH